MVDEVDDRLSNKEDNSKDNSQVEKTSELGLVQG